MDISQGVYNNLLLVIQHTIFKSRIKFAFLRLLEQQKIEAKKILFLYKIQEKLQKNIYIKGNRKLQFEQLC